MRRTSLLLIGMLSTSILAPSANAAPAYLSLMGSFPGHGTWSNEEVIDVSNGFTDLTITMPGTLHAFSPGPYTGKFFILGQIRPFIDNNQSTFINFDMTGDISGLFNERPNGSMGGAMHGSGVVTWISTTPTTTDPSDLPSWLPGLTATFSGFEVPYHYPSNGEMELTLTITAHPVPEPAALAVLGVGLFALAARRRRCMRTAV